MLRNRRIAVVGAGIAGLSTHYFLEREARRMGIKAHVETWDPRPAPGGNMRTATENGWQCEEAVESILNSRPETMELALDLGLADRIVQGSPLAKKRFIVWKGKPRSMGPADGAQGTFDHVVLAVPAFDAARIKGFPAELVPDLEKLPYNPVTVVGLGFDRSEVAHPLDGFGFLVPKSEGRRILGTLFSSSLWPHAAPAGKVLLRTMVGGGRQPELASLPDNDLVDMVRQELSELLGARGEPVYVQIARHARGIPEYPVGHHVTIRRLMAHLDRMRLHLAGNAWDGIGVNDCVAAALLRSRAILESARDGG